MRLIGALREAYERGRWEPQFVVDSTEQGAREDTRSASPPASPPAWMTALHERVLEPSVIVEREPMSDTLDIRIRISQIALNEAQDREGYCFEMGRKVYNMLKSATGI